MEKESNNIISKCESSVLSLKGCYNRIQWWQTTIMVSFIISILFGLYNTLLDKVIHSKEEMVGKTLTYPIPDNMFVQINYPFDIRDSTYDIAPIIKYGNTFEHIVAILLFMVLILVSWISISASVKRFHDIDKSGFWWWINFIPIVGQITVFFMNSFLLSKDTQYCECQTKEKKAQWLFAVAGILLLIPLIIDIVNLYDWNVGAMFFSYAFTVENVFYILLLLLMTLILNFDKLISISYLKKMKITRYISYTYVIWLVYNIIEYILILYNDIQMFNFTFCFWFSIKCGIQFSALCILILNTNKELKKVQNQKVS
ncbi:DUF805 domain-containing protein [Sulfurimonas sp.]|uniref:DUF805 domain-containing protein n=1 Tax=Sulfurimonas sp. TaxID=2022749 RepID=UPI002B48705E|nr:DUF805 domain-containing protein [Sulfurimonas sp.]